MLLNEFAFTVVIGRGGLAVDGLDLASGRPMSGLPEAREATHARRAALRDRGLPGHGLTATEAGALVRAASRALTAARARDPRSAAQRRTRERRRA